MSRTYRNTPDDQYFRRPKTRRERAQNVAVETDERWDYEYPIAKRNRRHRFIPTAYDDLPFADN